MRYLANLSVGLGSWANHEHARGDPQRIATLPGAALKGTLNDEGASGRDLFNAPYTHRDYYCPSRGEALTGMAAWKKGSKYPSAGQLELTQPSD